jgi:hypothetical protein
MGRPIVEGENPVSGENNYWVGILSSAGPEESCVKLPAPSGKAKYS